MAARDAIVVRFGLRTSREIRELTAERAHFDFFPLLARSPYEVEVGFDDRHLDFRAWLTLDETPRGLVLRSTTAVWAHNLFGRAYLRIIAPFHVAIVKTSLRRVMMRLRDQRHRSYDVIGIPGADKGRLHRSTDG